MGRPGVSGSRWDAEFVVEPTGRIDSTSIAIAHNGRAARHEGLRRAVLAASCTPALRNGCAVRFATGVSFEPMLVPVVGVQR